MDDLSWRWFKVVADTIVSSWKASHMNLHDTLPAGKSISSLSPPLTSDPATLVIPTSG